MTDSKLAFCFIGFGEAGQAIASGLRETGVEHVPAVQIQPRLRIVSAR
jgi:pyrroline-5-carboxylate reductase